MSHHFVIQDFESLSLTLYFSICFYSTCWIFKIFCQLCVWGAWLTNIRQDLCLKVVFLGQMPWQKVMSGWLSEHEVLEGNWGRSVKSWIWKIRLNFWLWKKKVGLWETTEITRLCVREVNVAVFEKGRPVVCGSSSEWCTVKKSLGVRT